MNVRSLFFPACYLAATLACLAATGCSVGQSRDAQNYAEYQAAAAAGDWFSARKALLRLLEEEDDVAEYWIALGTVQLELGAHADAFYAFSRANELERGNRQTLAALTQLALGGGALEMAEQHAKSLSLVAPDDPAVTLTYGYVALRRQDLDKADQMADRLLASYPLEPSAKLLKSRVLLARGKPDEATQLLDEQLKLKPDDIMSLRSIVALRKRNGEWSKVSASALRIAQLRPADTEYALLAIEAAFRAKEFDRGARISERFLQPDSSPEQLGEVLQIWADRWKSPEAIDRVRTFSRQAVPGQALAYATYFNESGAPGEIAAILGETPRLPINAANASANALIAVSMAARGQARPAKKVLDAILQLEPDHVYALRGRVNLMIKGGMAKAAINDAQRLVTIARTSAKDRLLLARVYAAAGDRRQVDRTLWNAFHDIPANHDLHEALRSHVQRTAGAEAAASVDREFQQQQETQFSREFY